jgi:cyclopropane fatty-acyl-phospholipid synthase-like methyltransferase
MNTFTTSKIRDMLRASITSAALGAALELQLFWRLLERPKSVEAVASELDIPPGRCAYWLELLAALNLLERRGEEYALSATARSAIVDAYSPETWSVLAQEARERYPVGTDLALHLGHYGSLWDLQGRKPPDYVTQMVEDPERAGCFTRMLYEIHAPLAEELADILDMSGVSRLLDLGGGSGIVALALLRRHPALTVVVVDIANVCVAGREIAAGTPFASRIAYHPANFLHDELPGGFDMILECDVGIYSQDLFFKLAASLNQGGRLVIVDDLPQANQPLSPSRSRHNFYVSLHNPDFAQPTSNEVDEMLRQAGLRVLSMRTMSSGELLLLAQK